MRLAEMLEHVRKWKAAAPPQRRASRRVQIAKGVIPWPGRPAARARHHAGSGRRP